MQHASVSLSVLNQLPDFVKENSHLFEQFLSYYYQSQERTGGPIGILNNLSDYFNLSKYDLTKLDGSTILIDDITDNQFNIEVETTDGFVEQNGTILVNDEVIYYESLRKSPNVILAPGISYQEFTKKKIELSNPYLLFDGIRTRFPLSINNIPVFPRSSNHIIVKIYNEYLIPDVDFTVEFGEIVFTTAPREFDSINLSDTSNDISIEFLKGFDTSDIDVMDLLIPSDEGEPPKYIFKLKKNNQKFIPASTVLTVAIVDGNLLIPLQDFSIYEDSIIFKQPPTETIYVGYINTSLLSVGSGAKAFTVVSESGEVESIIAKNGGSGYRLENTPKVSISGGTGVNATARALIGGIKTLTLLDSGSGYSSVNPPVVTITPPSLAGGTQAKAEAVVNNIGQIESVILKNSGSGYDFIPRVQFTNPSGAEVGNIIVDNNGIQSIEVVSEGNGYSVAPEIYIDPPTDPTGIQSIAQGVLNDSGNLVAVNILVNGTGYDYLNPPRVKVIQPTGAQILDVQVDDFGRVINIELLSGGFGYDNVPSVYIVDDRKDNLGNFVGGSGAKAIASIFNGEIIDINITDFGSGYSTENPPKVYISTTSGAKVSSEIGEDEVTGYEIISHGVGYVKSEFVNCARGVSGGVDFDSQNNLIFRSEANSIATRHVSGSLVTSLDSIFMKKIIDRISDQYIPGLPPLDANSLNISNILNTIKDFYSSKGTIYSIKYLFKLLYGTDVDVSYPKDQIIKPSASTWSIDTILRSKLISGNPENIKDALIEQLQDSVDDNVGYASALVENYTAIQTSDFDVYELILSEESIVGTFVIPYTTKLIQQVLPDDLIINVDSTIGWPERNGEIVLGDEIIRYKEKTLTQFIECTRGLYGTEIQKWDSGTSCSSNFYVYLNRGTEREVVLLILGIVDANKTTLLDDGQYYLSGDKLTISKLGTDDTSKLVTSWLYNVKKLLKIESMTFGGVNNKTVTVLCSDPHGLLVGDQFTVYGANPIVYNGTFLVTSRESATVFKYEIPQPAVLNPQGNILISIDLNTGKSDSQSINTTISKFPTNIQNTFLNENDVYVAASGLPNYKIGPFPGTALLPGNQRKLYKFPRIPNTISLKTNIVPGPIGSFINGVSIWSYKSKTKYPFGPITAVQITNPGKNYDAAVPPILTFFGGGGSGAEASVTINGSVVDFEVINGGSGYTDAPLVSIYGSDGIGATARAVVTNGQVTRILVNTTGTGYTSEPIVTITGGGGTGAEAKAIVRGPISKVNILNQGSSYTFAPFINISSGEGSAAQAYVSNGRIISIAIISAGSGYTTAPRVIITGDGYGAIAKANISTEGADLGRVTSIEIINRGIGYTQGTTQIRLESIGEGAQFQSQIFEWSFNLNETTDFDYANGSIFEGFNNQFGGEYAHISNPKQLRYVLGDNLDLVNGQLVERESVLHSPILGWSFDGNPIYGPYGLSDPTSLSSSVVPIQSSYVLKANLIYNENTNPVPVRVEGPALSEFPAGSFIEDYEYSFNSSSVYLDEYNGRFTKTPEFPDGVYAYFVTLDAAGAPKFPYIMGPRYYSTPEAWNLNQFALQSNIPTGVVRYRAPFENVDIDIERSPNQETNAITLENGDFLLYEIEDENKDGFISQSEIDDPDIMFEEDKLEVFDYFPKINISSKVDIEVETTTKFEDAKITGFLIENRGDSYQVGDRLVFDDEGTDGYGASARISEIQGKTITSYSYEYDSVQDVFKGVVQTSEQHNLALDDKVTVTTVPLMEPTAKTISVRNLRGIEKVNIEEIGTGYDPEIPPQVSIESTSGEYGEITPIVSANGVIDEYVINNSGDGYTSDPIIRVTHPQSERRADYFYTTYTSQSTTIINNGLVDSNKSSYFIGSSKTSDGNTHGFIQKISSDGTLVWSKSFSSTQPGTPNNFCELVSITKKDSKIYVVGRTRPNQSINAAFNPDIFVARLTENETGSSVSVAWQREMAGISGITRSDVVTDVTTINDNILLVGYTNTNTTSSQDGFLIYLNSSGDIITRRKITSVSNSEKLYSVKVDSNNNIFVLGNSSDNNILVSKLYVSGNRILVSWSKEYSISGIKFNDLSFIIDEYDQLFITSSVENLSTGSKNIVQFLRLSNDGSLVKNKFNTVSTGNISINVSKCSIDVFGDISVAYSLVNEDLTKDVGVLRFRYDGLVLKSSKLSSGDNTRGYDASVCISDVSGDPLIFGQVYDNRTQFLFNAESDYEDVTGRSADLTTSGTVSTNVDSKFGDYSYAIAQNAKLTASSLTNVSADWTLEKWIKWDSAATAKVPVLLRATDGSNGVRVVVFADSSSPTTYGKVRLSNDGATVTFTSTGTTYVTDLTSDWVHVKLTKKYLSGVSTYTLYWNGTQVASINENLNMNPTSIEFGSTTAYQSWPMKIDDIRYSNYEVTTTPTTSYSIVDYGNSNSYVLKTDKNTDAERLGDISLTNNNYNINRSLYTLSASEQDTEITSSTYTLGADGLQILDFNIAISSLTQDVSIPSGIRDLWSSRTATVPTVGGKKSKVSVKTLDKFYFKYFNVSKADNIVELELNQSFDYNVGTTLVQKNSIGATIATGKILSKDIENNKIAVGDVTGTFQLNTGYLETSDLFVNEISGYVFANVNDTTPGTFDISIPNEVSAEFKDYSDNDYLIRIDSVLAGSNYVVGSVVNITSDDISFNSDRTEATITNLTAVTQISLVVNLTKVLKIVQEQNTDTMFIRCSTSHYLAEGNIVYAITDPNYEPLSGTFSVNRILSKREFILKLRDYPTSSIDNESVMIYVKNPIFKFIYGQQYTFDTSHSSMRGRYLSFYRDNLFKIEYTFKNIIRRGVPGFDEPGNSPFISIKITDDVSNISYYADPSDLSEDGPVTNTSYIDIVRSPYIGTFDVIELTGGTVTQGATTFKFIIPFEPETNAQVSSSSYSTTSTKTVGPISKIRLINGGGFYKKLPVVSDIESSRKIERVEIVEPGTEYEAGEYFGVPILGDGTGGKVSLIVDPISDPPGQIVEVTVTDPGKNYTEAYIDVDAIDGILGPTLAGSGAVLNVVIPPKGTGASIFAQGSNVGKIKKLKNNNFGFNYTHDYTLRPEITFPVNLQLSNTNILSNITIVDPGTGYTTPPEVVIEGGGGSGATAEAFIRNGRISDIVVKNPGSGYSTPPIVSLKSAFTYVVNLDLGLFQFSFPHGIPNGAEVQFQVQDLGEGSTFPLTSFGYIDEDQIYYAISGEASGLEDDQLRIALTPQDAVSGNYIAFANAGVGRQIVLTSSFGGSAEAIVETGRFLYGEIVYQGDTYENASAVGYVSSNDGWQIGPRILKVTSVTGTFTLGQTVTGFISKSSGTIENISIAKGVLEVNSITKTVGKFLDDIGKPSEIVQKVQDSYLYQPFSYNIKSPVSIDLWRNLVIDNVHPAGFKVFGEINIGGGGRGLTDKTDFQLTKSVNLIESSVVSNIENFALVQPVYQEFDNTEVLFRSTRLTSSEEILTSVVQRIDDISNLFDGVRTNFPLTINGEVVIANTSQFMIVINGIAQTPGTSFVVQQGSIVFFEPPPAPTKISYSRLTLVFEKSYTFQIENASGIFPELGNSIRGLTTNSTATVISSTTNTLTVFNISGSFQNGEVIISTATGLNCNLVSQEENDNDNLFEFEENIVNTNGDDAKIEEINLDTNTSTLTNNIIVSKTSGTYRSPSGLLALELNDYIVGLSSGVVAKIVGLSPYQDPTTGEVLSSIFISDPSSFFGLLYNRIVNPVNPNTIVDDISKSLVEVTDINDSDIKVESRFVAFEDISNIILDYNYASGSNTISSDDLLQNIEIGYINQSGSFVEGEDIYSRKLTYHSLSGGNFLPGETITGESSGASADVIGINYALKILYLGNITSGPFYLDEIIENGSGVSSIVSNFIEIPFIAHQDDTINDNLITGQIDSDSRHIFRDAANLLRLNSSYIVEESAGRMKSRYPDLEIPGDFAGSLDGTNRCKLDLSLLLDAVIKDIENGGNYESVTAARFYLDSNGGLEYIRLQALQSLYAHNQMNDLCKQAILGSLSNTPEYTDNIPVPPYEIIVDQSSPACANVTSAIDSLWNQINDIIAPSGQIYRDAADQLWFNRDFIAQEATGYIDSYFTYVLNDISYKAFTFPGGDSVTCKRDITDYIIPSIITDLLTGGNANIISAMEYYIGNGDIQYIKGELLPTVVAIEKVNELCQYAIDNWIVNGTTDVEYVSAFGATAPKYIDNTIIPDDGTYGGNCERIKANIDTLFNIAIGILIPERNNYYGRYYDASNLIEENKTLIAEVAVGRMLSNYPGFSVPNGNQNCVDDIVDILTALVYDLRNGGNARIFDYAQVYTINTYLSGEETQSIYAFNQARDMAIQAMRNEAITIDGYSSLSQYFDNTVIGDQSGEEGVYTPGDCANVASSITTLISILTTAVTNGNMTHVTRQSESDTNKLYRDAATLILFNKEYIKYEALQQTLLHYPTFSVPGGNAKCLRDIGYIVDAIVYDLLTNGNSGILEATLSYIDAATGTIVSLEGELIQSIYAYNRVKDYLKQSVSETLTSPASGSGQYAYLDGSITITGSDLTEIETFIDEEMSILIGTLNNPSFIEINSIVEQNALSIPSKSYPIRNKLTPVKGSISVGEYIYGVTSGQSAEVNQISINRGYVKNIFKRFEIEYTTASEVFQQGDELDIQAQPGNTCIIDSIENGEFVSYIDVLITAGNFSIGNTLINGVGFTASIVDITERVQLVDTIGQFTSNSYVKGLYSGMEGTITNYEYNYSPVLSTNNSRLILETEFIQGEFIPTRRVYSSLTSQYIDVINSDTSYSVGIGDIIQTERIYRLQIEYDSEDNLFILGNEVVNSANYSNKADILGYEIIDSSNAYLYIANIEGSMFSTGSTVFHFTDPIDQFPSGLGVVTNVSNITSKAYARVERVSNVGNYNRLYLSSIVGTINQYAQVISNGGYRSGIVSSVIVEGRISRSFIGFNGQQTLFKLTTNNGDPYFPDSDGHMLVFVNGILQPPGTAFFAFSDSIQFAEPPEIGASFSAVYIGKLRQLDDISFEFDSLRNTFNLKLDEVFYSLTLTPGVQSTNIKPENNIIISLNGVIQEPGIAFELIGSRLIFAEVPRAGSTFVAFSYIGSDADVIASEVIPPIEVGDELEIEGETEDRKVAVIESSNSLITFDYLGSVLGRNASALSEITKGRIERLQLTSGGDGYTSRPTVSFDSSTGFDGQAKALVGISRVDVVERGSNYQYPIVTVDNLVPEPLPSFEFQFDDDDATFDTSAVTFDQT